MPVLSPRLSEILVKTTHSRGVDDALNKVFTEYLELKLLNLNETISRFQKKWDMSFDEFKGHMKGKSEDTYSYETESDFWEWEEAETQKKHFSIIREQWF